MSWFNAADTPVSSAQRSFPCQQCGAQLDFAPGTNELVCGHCGHRHRISESRASQDVRSGQRQTLREYDYYSALNALPGSDATAISLTTKCDSCAAEFEFDRNIHSDECPFCGTRIVVDSSEHRSIKPEAVLPFHITTEQASDKYRHWLKRLWFAPNKLKKYARKDSQLNGMYIPYWTYDCNTRSTYSGERGTLYQVPMRVRVKVNGRWTTQTRMVTKVKWRPARGTVGRTFDDILVFASDSMPRQVARELSPWDLENLAPYDEQYLSGFRSEMYHTDLEQGFGIARERMNPIIRSDVAADIGGDQQRIHNLDTEYSNITFKHILLPFWIAGFRFRKKTYRFIVNGRTGEVQGERPYSFAKITLAVIFGAVLVFTTLAFFAQNPNGEFSFPAQEFPSISWPSQTQF